MVKCGVFLKMFICTLIYLFFDHLFSSNIFTNYIFLFLSRQKQTINKNNTMNINNKTAPSEFIFQTFSDLIEWHFFLSGFMTFTLFFTVMGNALIIFLIFFESNLQIPMYFFLNNLSVLDICLNTTIVPQLMVNLISGRSIIAYERCKIQVFFYGLFVGSEFLLLGVMAYDCYVAICNPLCYTMVMSQKLCRQLLSAIWLISSLNSTIPTIFTFSLLLCRDNKINYFYCVNLLS